MTSTQIRYCPDCCQNVTVKSGVSIGLLIVLLLFGVVPGIIYFCLMHKPKCPKCGAEGDRLLPQRMTAEECRHCEEACRNCNDRH